ncbi:phosphoglycerate kinase [Candidatus Woesearchaeota archaeon]|nr:phosphoglycerate kinase [Candidatus Woesearchaeota archaeon]
MFSVEELDVEGKKVLVRVDFNVPLSEGKVADDKRIRAAMPTIRYLLEKKAAVILMSHLGKPKGKYAKELSMNQVVSAVEKVLGQKICFSDDCIGEETEKDAEELKPGDVLLLENLRFHEEEKENAPEFAKSLASLADFYVNDAFGTCHRKHASVYGVAEHLPSAAGKLVEKELEELGKLNDPEKPFMAVMGGKKVSDKITVIKALLRKVDKLLIGGAMANTFLKALGKDIGKSVFEEDKLELARELLKDDKIIIPADVVCAEEVEEGAETKEVDVDSIPAEMMCLDIGEKTIDIFRKELEKAKTVFWNGTMGVAEIGAFKKGTAEVAKFLAEMDADVVTGGGDTAAAVDDLGLGDKMTWVSTGGGAALKFLEGEELPAISALEKSYEKFK